VGLHQHRELLVPAGWLALLIGCIEYDMGMRASAETTRTTAAQLGTEADANHIVGWTYEMAAWFALTQGHYRSVLQSTATGTAIAGKESVAVQLIGQEAKALGRLGDIQGVRDALERGSRHLRELALPSRNDNHFEVDPDKWAFYAMDAYRLAGETGLAEEYAHEVVAKSIAPDMTERSPMRLAEARLTLAIVECRRGELERAIGLGLVALDGQRKSLPSLLMISGELDPRKPSRPDPGPQGWVDAPPGNAGGCGPGSDLLTRHTGRRQTGWQQVVCVGILPQ
jgi:hypothetical protein